MEKMKVKRIKPDALVTGINVGATFYSRMQVLMMDMIENHGVDKATEIINRFKKDAEYSPQSIFEENLVTVLSFLYLVEEKANAQGLMEDFEMDVPPGAVN